MIYRLCNRGLARLEPCAVKVASTVLRGLGGGNVAWLPDPAGAIGPHSGPYRATGRSRGPGVVVVIVVGLFDYDNDNASVPGISVTTSVLIAPHRARRGALCYTSGPLRHRNCFPVHMNYV